MENLAIYRDQINSHGAVIETMRFVGVDCAGYPSFVSMRNRIIAPYLFQSREWAKINLTQCQKYSESGDGTRFEFRLVEAGK